MIGYKGFNSELKCKGYQYEIGKTYTIDSDKELAVCPKVEKNQAGLHFCKNPVNVLDFYPNEKGNRFCVVESIGKTISDYFDTKVATDKLKVIKEINFSELMELGVEYRIKNGYRISDKEFEWCSETLKEKYILKCIKNSWYISNKMKKWYENFKKKNK